VACTGKQFCNIAVTDTKGHMLRLLERLRERKLALHGIRIHMSGCPSSCAQHHTADIGLKGVRVRRLLGTREGFDVYLGGGVAGDIHLGILYKLGVDVDQLPQVVEEVVAEYYRCRQPGLTFSAYWREKLRAQQAAKVVDGEFTPPIWICDNCQYQHLAEDPPVYCPKCAGLRRHFARVDPSESEIAPAAPDRSSAAPGGGEFVVVARDDQVVEGSGLAVEIHGRELALFRVEGEIRAIENTCPHSGGPLAEGSLCEGVVTCPWHGWTFNVRNGQGVSHPDLRVGSFSAKVENGQVLVRLGASIAVESP
jgi:nitrite reductase/ring-hydroxylating ferredoxin subunit